MDIEIVINGDIVERQELLNGTQTITIEGASDDGAWTLVGSISWNRGLKDYAGEGDLTLTRGGDDIFATLTNAEVRDAPDDATADHSLALEYDVDGGAGTFSDASGRARATGWLAGDRFGGRWTLTLEP